MKPKTVQDLECDIYLIDALMQMHDGVPVSELKPRVSPSQARNMAKEIISKEKAFSND